ncbi:hypothetical protein ACIQNV_37520 [Streptomyces hydrogenans]|uniref:hypothetical protein n=1 Tax=Streptomyces hydrogenans TaxID=1873719 RepID=UPI0037F49A50
MVDKMDSAKDVISHQAVANILNGKNFPAWPKVEVLISALFFFFANAQITSQEITAIRELWLAAHYEDDGSAPPVSFRSGSTSEAEPNVGVEPLLESDLFPIPSVFDVETTSEQEAGSSAGDETDHDASPFEEMRVRFISQPSPGPDMFSVDLMAGMLQVVVNEDHPLGRSILHVIENGDETSSQLVKALLFSWARMEDEIPSSKQRNSVSSIRNDWGRYARWFGEPEDDE